MQITVDCPGLTPSSLSLFPSGPSAGILVTVRPWFAPSRDYSSQPNEVQKQLGFLMWGGQPPQRSAEEKRMPVLGLLVPPGKPESGHRKRARARVAVPAALVAVTTVCIVR